MPYWDQDDYDVRCEWGAAGLDHLAPSEIVIVVDVLSFSTTVDVALSRGVIVYPYRWNDETAVSYAHERSAALAVARGLDGSHYSLSPASMLTAPPGLRLVLPSPNGSTIAFHAISDGAHVAAGSLRNAAAVADWAVASGGRVTVIPAGERWPDGSLRPAIEDLIGAGAIISNLRGTRSPEAEVALAAFERFGGTLLDPILGSASGRELVERGFPRDVELATELNVSDAVPILVNDSFERF